MAVSATQVSVESVGNLERRMTLKVPAGDVDNQVGGRLREIARTARIKGFRPGKVPAKVIEQRFGQQVRAEVLDGLLREGFNEAVRSNELRIAGNPRIEPAGDEGDAELAYVATFELVPDFGEIDVAKLEVVRNTAEVSDEDVERMIGNLREQRRTWTVVKRAAKAGDAVEIESWSQAGDERLPAEGADRGTSVVGSAARLPAIDAALAGMSAGDVKQVEVDFPANLERELKGALMGRLRRAVGEQLAAAYASVELPPRLVEQEARGLAQQALQQARQQGQQAQLKDDAHQAFMEPARKRVLLALLIGEIARRNELRLDPKRVNELLRLIASTYEDPQQVIDLYRNDPQLMSGLQSRAMEEQVIDWIAERAQHTEKAMTFQEAIG